VTAPARVQQTPGWLRDQIPDLLGLATALTGSADAAADLVAQTILRTPRRLSRQPAGETADDDLLALLVGRFLATHRRRTAGVAAAGQLDALSPPARAAVVLRDGLGMTPMTIASVLDRPPAQVSAELATAGSCAEEVAPLRSGATDLEQVYRRIAAARGRSRTRRRRLVALGTVIALLIGAALSVPTFWLPRLPAEVRTAGVWQFSHVVRLPRGWIVTSRTLTTTTETTQFQPPGRTHNGCAVTVHTAGGFDDTGTIRLNEAAVHGRDGFVGQDRSGNYLLAWEYADQAWAQVSCATTRLDESLLVTTAKRVRFRPAPARIPYLLTALPQGYRVLSLTEFPLTGSTELHLGRDNIEPGEVNLVIAAPLEQIGATRLRGRTLRVDGFEGRISGGSNPRICVSLSAKALCVLTYWPGGTWPEPAPDPVQAEPALAELAETIRLAPSLPDQRTWYDAQVALPR
jgi:DNA-directed RNA polymerase specialized sigma24 family protein